MKYKFDKPIKTKSGRGIVELWNELKNEKRLLSKYTYFESNRELRWIHSVRINQLEDDIGMTLTIFPEFTKVVPKDDKRC